MLRRALLRTSLVVTCGLWLATGCCASDGTTGAARGFAPPNLSASAVRSYGAGHAFYQLSEPLGTPVGTMIVIHGGGWADNGPQASELQMQGAVDYVLSQGWRVLDIGYTSAVADASAPNPVPTLADVAAFYDQTRADFSGPICAMGYSAGGHLALMLAVERPHLTCVVSNAGPGNLTADGNRRYTAIVRSVFGSNRSALRWWSPASRWASASPRTKVWIGDAIGDPIVPPVGPSFQKVDPSATVTELPAARANTPGAIYFVHSWVQAAAFDTYYARLSRWLQTLAGSSPDPEQADPGPGRTLDACDAGRPSGARLLTDRSGWRPVATPFSVVRAYRSCEGRGSEGWEGLALLAEPSPPGKRVPNRASAEFQLTAPAGRTFSRLTARYRGWFKNLASWDLELDAATSRDGAINIPVAGCRSGTCRGLSTSPSSGGTQLTPAAVGRGRRAGAGLPKLAVKLPAGTVRLAWRLTCVASEGCDGASINPDANPYATNPTRPSDPLGHPAEFTLPSVSVALGRH